jgi:hypothetical protein
MASKDQNRKDMHNQAADDKDAPCFVYLWLGEQSGEQDDRCSYACNSLHCFSLREVLFEVFFI